jgi:hypothetical protein
MLRRRASSAARAASSRSRRSHPYTRRRSALRVCSPTSGQGTYACGDIPTSAFALKNICSHGMRGSSASGHCRRRMRARSSTSAWRTYYKASRASSTHFTQLKKFLLSQHRPPWNRRDIKIRRMPRGARTRCATKDRRSCTRSATRPGPTWARVPTDGPFAHTTSFPHNKNCRESLLNLGNQSR